MVPMDSEQTSSIETQTDSSPETSIAKKEPNVSKRNASSFDQQSVMELVSLVGQISTQISHIQSKSDQDIHINQEFSTFTNLVPLIGNLLHLSTKALQYSLQVLNQTTNITPEALTDLLSFLQILNDNKKIRNLSFEHIRELTNILDLKEFSLCPTCNSLEHTIDFLLCDSCHHKLIIGEDIQDYLQKEWISARIPITRQVINLIRQRFSATVRQITYESVNERKTRQLLQIPESVHLEPDHTYNFMIIPQSYELEVEDINVQDTTKQSSESSQDTNLHHISTEICRNCGIQMKFLRTTMYYETTCDLYRCDNCGMEKMNNFQPIWDSGLDEEP